MTFLVSALVLIFSLLVFINANRFTAIAWVSVTMMMMGLVGYTFFGWIGIAGALLFGIAIFGVIYRLVNL